MTAANLAVEVERLRLRLAAAEALIEALRHDIGEHRPWPHTGIAVECEACGDDWPCLIVQAVDRWEKSMPANPDPRPLPDRSES